MAVSLHGFRVQLYEEHLEEASALYEQILSYRADPELSWLDLAPFEERLEAHLDALVVGGDLAEDVACDRARSGDFGEAYAALRVLVRRGRAGALRAVLEAVDPEDPEAMRSLEHAAREEPGSLLFDQGIGEALAGREIWQRLVLANAASARLSRDPHILELASGADEALGIACARALAHVAGTDAVGWLEDALGREDRPALRRELCRTLLSVGAHRVPATLLQESITDPELWRILAHLVDAESGARCIDRAASGGAAAQIAVMGTLGDPAHTPRLLELVEAPEHAEAAAEALYATLGADLRELVFVPEEEDEEEAEDLTEGAADDSGAGAEARGVEIERISQDAAAWRAFWAENAGRFPSGVRHRIGQPCTASRLCVALRRPELPARLRSQLLDELAIRYGIDAGFSVESEVRRQLARLASIEAPAAADSSPPGAYVLRSAPG